VTHGTDKAVFGLGDGSDAPNGGPVTTGADNTIDALTGTQAELDAHTADATDAHDASAVSVDSTGLVGVGTDVQTVLGELDDGIADHLADTADAHDASAVSVDSTGLVGIGTDVQTVLGELDDGVADHLADTTGAHAASAISVDSTNLDGTQVTVQLVLEELETQVQAAASTHAGTDLSASVHGFKGQRKWYADGLNEAILVTEIQTMDLGGADPVANGDTYKVALGAAGTNKTALLTYTDAAAGVTHAAEIQVQVRLVAGYEAATVAAVDANTFTFTMVSVVNPDQAQVTDKTGFTCDTPDANGFATNTPYVAATTYTVTGCAVGDILTEVTVYVNKAAIATSTMRALADYSITGANTVTVIANNANHSAPDVMLFEYTDLT
jgi:hypothetical protein